MANTKDVSAAAGIDSFLFIGHPGSGKTTQFHTLPPGGFMWIFDPNALASLRGADIEYEIFSPDILSLDVVPLKADNKRHTPIMKPREPKAYEDWEDHFEWFVDNEEYKRYSWIGIDSFTTFQQAVMDSVLWLNKRQGKHPEIADWTAQMNAVQAILRALSALDRPIFCTAHDEARKDDLTGGIDFQPVFTGRLRTRALILFANVWRFQADSEVEGKRRRAVFDMYTVSDRRHQYVRNSYRGLEPIEDVTIPHDEDGNFINPQEHGVGRLLKGLWDEDDKVVPIKKEKGKKK